MTLWRRWLRKPHDVCTKWGNEPKSQKIYVPVCYELTQISVFWSWCYQAVSDTSEWPTYSTAHFTVTFWFIFHILLTKKMFTWLELNLFDPIDESDWYSFSICYYLSIREYQYQIIWKTNRFSLSFDIVSNIALQNGKTCVYKANILLVQ